MGGVLNGTFIAHTCLISRFTFGPFPWFRWYPSPEGFIPFFSFRVSLFLSKSSLKARMGICLCCEGPCPLGFNFSLFRQCYCFVGFSSFGIVFAMLKFFDEIPIRSRLGFFLGMFKLTFIHSIHLSTRNP